MVGVNDHIKDDLRHYCTGNPSLPNEMISPRLNTWRWRKSMRDSTQQSNSMLFSVSCLPFARHVGCIHQSAFMDSPSVHASVGTASDVVSHSSKPWHMRLCVFENIHEHWVECMANHWQLANMGLRCVNVCYNDDVLAMWPPEFHTDRLIRVRFPLVQALWLITIGSVRSPLSSGRARGRPPGCWCCSLLMSSACWEVSMEQWFSTQHSASIICDAGGRRHWHWHWQMQKFVVVSDDKLVEMDQTAWRGWC